MSEWDKFVEKQLKNPEVRAEYDALEPEFAAIQAKIDAQRIAGPSKMKQADITSVAV